MERKEATKIALELSGVKESSKIFTRLGQAEQFIREQPIYYDKAKLWWYWNKIEYRWELVDETDILNLINHILDIDTINSKAKTEILESLKQCSRLKKPKDIKKTWIQFHDTIFDIETGDLMTATSEYFVTNPIPYQLHPEKFEETPNIDRIFQEWVGPKHVKTLYQIISYCLIPDYPIHRIFCFIGGGMNGKSKFLDLLRKFLNRRVCNH